MSDEQRRSVYQYNQQAWDQAAGNRERWSTPVGPETIAAARRGEVSIILTPLKPIPGAWLGDLVGRDVLLLAGSGGQQAPVVAAAGANVTVADLSAGQLALDREVADREGLGIQTIQCSMDDLTGIADGAFDLVIHPCSNTFVPNVVPVWEEAFRVLRPGGELLSGFLNPAYFLFDETELAAGRMQVRYRVPYSDLEQRSTEQLDQFRSRNEPLCFGHRLEDQLGGQMRAGFQMIDLYEDYWGPGESEMVDRHLPTFLATRSRKPLS